MFRKRLVIAAWVLAWTLEGASLADDGIPPGPAPAPATPSSDLSRQVEVRRLQHADAARLADELSGVLDPRRVRLVAYAPSNSLVIMGAQEVQKIMADLIGRLDVQPTQAAIGAAGPARGVTLIRVEPPFNTSTQAGGAAPSRPTTENQQEVIKVIRVPNRDLGALVTALSEVARSRGSSVRTIVVTPPREEQPTQSASRPAETRQR